MPLIGRQSFVFISYSRDDASDSRHKSNFKLVLDTLIRAGFKLWLDQPEIHGYSAAEIAQHFLRVQEGRPWRQDLNDALRLAGCVLFLASTRFLEPKLVWHNEVHFAFTNGTLLPTRIDDVDLEKAEMTIVRGLTSIQVADLRLAPGNDAHAQEYRRTLLAFLLDAVTAKLNEQSQRRYGTFDPKRPSGDMRIPTAEQLDDFFLMLDRETEVDEVAASRSPISVIIAAPEARAGSLQARLHRVEFPFRFPSSRSFGNVGPTEGRALILGRRGPSQQWTPVPVSWPRPADSLEKRCRAFVTNLVSKSPHSRGQKVDSDLFRTVSQYFRALKPTGLRLFACSRVSESDVLTEPHVQLAGKLHELFANGPPDRFRLFISAGPRSSRTLPRWMQDDPPIELGELAESDLDEWISLMTLLVEKSESELRQMVKQAFMRGNPSRPDSGPRLSFADLEEALRPHAEYWVLRKRRAARNAPKWETQTAA